MPLFTRKGRTDDWGTPGWLYKLLDNEFHFDFDPCPYPKPDWDGRLMQWGKSNFVNPPYSDIQPWAQRCREEQVKGNTSVLLIPARTDTAYFHRWIILYTELRFIEGRVQFVQLGKKIKQGKRDAPFPSMVCIFHGS